MTYSPTVSITIGDDLLPLTKLAGLEVISAWENLTDTAIIRLPRNIVVKKSGTNFLDKKLTDIIKKGDKVVISLGRDGDNKLLYTGYVISVRPELPVEIHCEDAMSLLKNKAFSASYKAVTLKELLSDMLENEGLDNQVVCADISLGTFRVANATAAQVLKEIKNKYGFAFYFRDEKLYAGLTYELQRVQVRHIFEMNMGGYRGNIAQSNLEWSYPDEKTFSVEAISMNDDGTTTKVKVGDDNGEKRTLHFYNIRSESELKRIAESEIKKIKTAGYTGSLTAWVEPKVQHGDIAEIRDGLYPERNGSYLIDEVNTTFTLGGIRQTIKIGDQVS